MKKNKILLIGISLLAFSFIITAQDQIKFTWTASWMTGTMEKKIKIQATEGENFIVDWGDGTSIEIRIGTGNSDVVLTYTYAEAGEYIVTITADSEDCKFTSLDCDIFYIDYSIYHIKNDITELDLSACPNLTNLNCYGNQLATLDVSANTVLQTLNCGWN